MTPLDRQPNKISSLAPGEVEAHLRDISQELEYLKHSLVFQLSQEIEQLQTKKNRLLTEIEELESQYQQQITQQQELAKQIAPALANQLHNLLRENLNQQREGNGSNVESIPQLGDYNEKIYQLISSFDSTLRNTFHTLQQDLSSYQSSFSQQLGQMYTLEQQGEAILEALVSRLRKELETPVGSSSLLPPKPESPTEKPSDSENSEEVSSTVSKVRKAIPQPEISKPPPTTSASTKSKNKANKAAKIRLGFALVLLSYLSLSLMNIVIAIIFNKSSIFGLFETGSYIYPSFGNSVLILFLQMIWLVPLRFRIARGLYPQTWQDIQKLIQSQDLGLFVKVIACGFFLFLSETLMYLALGYLSPGVVQTIFFLFPILTVPSSWLFFGDRPTLIRSLGTMILFLGMVLIVIKGSSGIDSISPLGVISAIASGITFAFHLLLMQACSQKIHPLVFNVVNFITIFIVAGLSLFIVLPQSVSVSGEVTIWSNLIISSMVLGGLTLLSYLTQNLGFRYIGAAGASIFEATIPILTSLLAWIIIGSSLAGLQIIAIPIVSLGIAILSWEKLYGKPKPTQAAK